MHHHRVCISIESDTSETTSGAKKIELDINQLKAISETVLMAVIAREHNDTGDRTHGVVCMRCPCGVM